MHPLVILGGITLLAYLFGTDKPAGARPKRTPRASDRADTAASTGTRDESATVEAKPEPAEPASSEPATAEAKPEPPSA